MAQGQPADQASPDSPPTAAAQNLLKTHHFDDIVGGASREPFPVAVEAAREMPDPAIPQETGVIFTPEDPLSEVEVEGSEVNVEGKHTSDKVEGKQKVEVMGGNVASGKEGGHGDKQEPAIASSSPDLLQNPLGALGNWWDSAVTAVAQPLSNISSNSRQ